LPYVCERFFRGARARASASSGSGLGLSIAKWIVEKHGGTIAVSSTGDGTDVVIRIPALG
jgi:signal transduction histidine kinase